MYRELECRIYTGTLLALNFRNITNDNTTTPTRSRCCDVDNDTRLLPRSRLDTDKYNEYVNYRKKR